MNCLSIQVDKKYINLLSPKLEGFGWKGDGTAIFRCPMCGDSKKNKNKKRGYIYSSKDKYMVKCHNCGVSLTFKKFLKQLDFNLHKEYIYENFKYNNDHRWFENRLEKQTEKAENLMKTDSNDPLHCLDSISDLRSGHKAYDYVISRKIPKEFWSKIFYTNNFKQWINENVQPDKFNSRATPDERLVIPFLNGAGIPYAYQGRYIGSNKDEQRYISINPVKSNPMIYGLERLESNKPIYVVEGPLDSLSLVNGIAVAGTSFSKLFEKKRLNLIFWLDNESHSNEICKLMKRIIDLGHKVVIWDNNYDVKDINDMSVLGVSTKEIMEYAEKRTFQGLRATLEFNNWKKV